MNKVCLHISLAVAVLLASSRLGFAGPQNGLETNGLNNGGTTPGKRTAWQRAPEQNRRPPRQPQVIRMLRAR